MSNKISTLGYFKKRLKSCGYEILDVFKDYGEMDSRVWTILINPGKESIYCTYNQNVNRVGDDYFSFYDNGRYIRNLNIATDSIEVIVNHLMERNIKPVDKKSS
jgi:hypothetical protein